MANIFNSVSAKIPKRNKFRLNHQVKMTGEMGNLMPVLCEPILPGDRFKLSSTQLIRFAPMVAPIMSDIDCYMHFFFVPNRLIWDEWETFITASKKGKKLNDEDVPVPPRLKIPNSALKEINPLDNLPLFGTRSLADYLGFPTVDTDSIVDRTSDFYADELPFRAYQKIFFDWYRDENLYPEDDFDELFNKPEFNNGDNDFNDDTRRTQALLKLQRRAWKKDYFTSALPWAQKGDDVLIPGSGGSLSGNGILSNAIGQDIPSNNISGFRFFSTRPGTTEFTPFVDTPGGSGSQSLTTKLTDQNEAKNNLYVNESLLTIDTDKVAGALSSGVSEGTIRELRRAMAAQRFLEREAVGGTRYIEQILSFFGVKSSDARLQRSEFLGGSKQPVVISQVLQTSQTTQGDNGSPLGQPAGNAVSAGGKYIFDRTFEEHGFLVGIMSVIPRAEYMNGMPRKYLKRDRFDYYFPQFARIGEQPIFSQELKYSFANPDYNETTFGYTPRYAEYRFINSTVHGDFKKSLLYWTLVRDFDQQNPLLNQSFIECKPSQRVFAYTDEEFNHLWIQIGFNISALRPLPKYGESI